MSAGADLDVFLLAVPRGRAAGASLDLLDGIEAGEAGADDMSGVVPLPRFIPFAMAGLYSALFRETPDEATARACPIVVGGEPAGAPDKRPRWRSQLGAMAGPDGRSVIVIGQMRPARPGEVAIQLVDAGGQVIEGREASTTIGPDPTTGVFAKRLMPAVAAAKVRLVDAESRKLVLNEVALSAPMRADGPNATGFLRGLEGLMQRLFDPDVHHPLAIDGVLKILRQIEDPEKLAVLAAHPLRFALVPSAAADAWYGRWRELLAVEHLELTDTSDAPPEYPDAQLASDNWEAWRLPAALIDAVIGVPEASLAVLAADWGRQRFQSWMRGSGDAGPSMPLLDVLVALRRIGLRARDGGMDVHVGWRSEA